MFGESPGQKPGVNSSVADAAKIVSAALASVFGLENLVSLLAFLKDLRVL